MQKNSPILNNLSKNQKLTILIIIIAFIGLLIYTAVTLVSRIGKVNVEVYFAPYSAKVTLNGTEIKNKASVYLIPGNYELEVSCEHFETLTKQITIDNNHRKLLGILEASDSEGEAYIEAHQLEFTEVEGLVGVYLNEEGERIKDQYPILNHLPFNSSLYSISYDYEEEGSRPVINIKSQDYYLDAAVAKLKIYGEGDDLIQYKIFFSGNNNPFMIPVADSTAQNPQTFIKETYAADQNSYIVSDGVSIDNYYVATIQSYNFDNDLYLAHYRIVLQKQGNSWKIIEYPQPFLTTHNMPNVPVEVLNAGNNL